MYTFNESSESKNERIKDIGEKFRISQLDNLILGGNPPHYHTMAILYLLLDGRFETCIEEKIYTVKPGNLILLAPRIIHHRNCKDTVVVSRGIIYFDLSLISPAMQERLFVMDEYMVDASSSLDEVNSLFDKIKRESESPDEFSAENICGHIGELVALFFRLLKKSGETIRKNSPGFIESSISFIKKNYASHIGLMDAAKHVSISSKYLSRVFKKETGVKFSEYLNLYRLKKSEIMLLEEPEKSILEIAYDNGFNDSNYFSICFKKRYGVSPSVFRKNKLSH